MYSIISFMSLLPTFPPFREGRKLRTINTSSPREEKLFTFTKSAMS